MNTTENPNTSTTMTSKPSTSALVDPDDGESSFSEISDDESIYPESVCESVTDNYQNELDQDFAGEVMLKKRKVLKASRFQQSKIPAHLKGLLGEANLRWARGETVLAEKMCLELIRQAVYAHEPYVTLSQIYENSHPEKSLQYATMAAHLNPSNSEHWIRLYNMHMETNSIKQAVTCLTKALSSDSRNIKLHLKRIKLLESLEDYSTIRRCKMRLLSAYSRTEHEKIITSAKELTEELYKDKLLSKAIEVMSVPFKKCPKHITPELINIYLQLLLENNKFLECLDVFVQFCNVEIELLVAEDQKVNILSYTIPPDIAIDLRIKVVICMIKLGASHLVSSIIDPLLENEEHVENIGDLYFDVAEAFISMEEYSLALKLLVPLVKSINFSLAAIWLKYADCLKHLNMVEQAIDAYSKVVKLAPQHLEVRYPLSDLLIQQGNFAGAIAALTQSTDSCELDVALLIKKINLVKERNDYEEYFKCAEDLVARHSVRFLHQEELHVAIILQERSAEKFVRLQQLREMRKIHYIPHEITSLNEPSVEEEYALFKEILTECWQRKYYTTLQKLVFMGLVSNRFKQFTDEMLIIGYYAALMNKDSHYAYVLIRDMITKGSPITKSPTFKDKNIVWNMLTLYTQRQEDARYYKFIYRCGRRKGPYMSSACMLEAANSLATGSAKLATLQLLRLIRLPNPSTLVRLMLATALVQISGRAPNLCIPKCTKTSHALITQYAQERGVEAKQEVYYNLGRWYQHKGVLHLATHFYKLALEIKPAIVEKHPSLDLSKEAAFNLMLIYKNSGDIVGAQNLVIKYLTI